MYSFKNIIENQKLVFRDAQNMNKSLIYNLYNSINILQDEQDEGSIEISKKFLNIYVNTQNIELLFKQA